ncbi:MAG: AzlD domain-containing protein [Spirochaetes bacterium]|nr:MAG: AzlD domain-containing protein [Spirochaetota bacterium]
MEIIILVLAMGAVTYLPRLLPFYFIDVERIPARLKLFLSFIPYAALGALLLPGGMYAVEGRPLVSALGIAASAAVAWFNGNLILTVILSAVATSIMIAAGL